MSIRLHIPILAKELQMELDSAYAWLGIKNDYRTLIGVDSLEIIEKAEDDEDEENSDV